MEEIRLISTVDICRFHDVDDTFIGSLNKAGLIVFEEVNQTAFISENELEKLERLIRLHNELEINVAGLEAISHLLERIVEMQEQIRVLKNRAIVQAL